MQVNSCSLYHFENTFSLVLHLLWVLLCMYILISCCFHLVSKRVQKKRKERSWWGDSQIWFRGSNVIHELLCFITESLFATHTIFWVPGTPPISRSALCRSSTLANVEAAINKGWNGSDFCAQFLFHASKIVSVIICYQVDSESQVAETSRTTNSVKVGLRVLWEIKIDYHIDRLNVNTSSKQVYKQQKN